MPCIMIVRLQTPIPTRVAREEEAKEELQISSLKDEFLSAIGFEPLVFINKRRVIFILPTVVDQLNECNWLRTKMGYPLIFGKNSKLH